MRLLLSVFILATQLLCAAEKPNVVLLLADDLGWKDLRCYGGPVKTPALDRLAGSGARFTDFHSGAAVCSPSRATLLTGRHHVRTGVYSWINDQDQNSHLLESEVTIAELLKSAGYATAHFGKWHLGLPNGELDKPTPSDHGFDYWFATGNNARPSHRNPDNFIRNGDRVGQLEGYACQLVAEDAIRWLEEERDAEKPFFLNVWFHEPHAPIAAPDDIVADYGETTDPAAIYSGTIDNMDRAIEQLLERLDENTLVIFSSDNGSYRRDRVGELRDSKGSNFEGGIRVPGIFSWPGRIPTQLEVDEPAGLIDLLPTICGLLEIEPPEGVHLDGVDLTPLLTGEAEKIKRAQPLAWILPLSGRPIAIRDGRYALLGQRKSEFPRDREAMAELRRQMEEVLAKNGDPDPKATIKAKLFEGFKDREADRLRGQFIRLNQFHESWIPSIKAMDYHGFELFDLETDLAQQTNVADEHPEIAERLTRQLLALTADVVAEGPNWVVEKSAPDLGWNRFRGPNGWGVAESANPPIAIDASQLAWKTKTPAGLSSPVLSTDKVFLTAHDGDELVVLAYSKSDGSLLWRRSAPAPPSEAVHEAGSQAASTPFVDERRVYAYFGSFGILCLDHDGSELWKKPIPTPKTMYGMSTSPIGFGETIVLVLDDDRNLPDSELSRSKMIAVNRATGETVWETKRPFNRSGWSTPMIWSHEGAHDLVVLGNGRLEGYNPTTGESKWWITGFSRETISSPIAGAGMVFGSASKQGGSGDVDANPAPFWNALQSFDSNADGQIQRAEMTGHFTFPFRPELPPGHPGFGMPLPKDKAQRKKRIDHMLTWFDKNEDGAWSREEFEAGFQVGRGRPLLAAVAPGGSGDVTESHIRWEIDRSIPEIPTPIFLDGLIYLIRKGGILSAIDAASGELVYRERIDDAGGQYAASPVIANDHLILVSSLGQISMVRTGREFELVHQFALEETTETTPAIDEDTIYIRSAGHLRAFRQGQKSPVTMLLDRSCLDCHDRDTATPINLEALAFDLTEPENFRSWEKVFDQIESGEMPPEDKPRPDQQLLTEAMGHLQTKLRDASLAEQTRNGRAPVRRLTRTEYEFTMHDLLGIGGSLASKLPPENDSSSFDTVANDQGISPVHIKSFLAAADLALDEAIQLGPKPNSSPREIDYKNHSYVKMWFERELRRGGDTVKRTADAFVTFDGRPHTTQTDNMGIKFPVAGKYRIEAEVFGYQAETPVTFCIYRANDIDGKTEMIGSWQIDPGDTHEVELASYFSSDDYFYLVPEDLDQADSKTIFQHGAKTYPGEGVGVRRFTLEGPLESEWPPTRTRQLLGEFEPEQTPLGRITNIISRIGARAFRRPLSEGESALWASFARPALDEGRGFEAGLRVALRAMLSSPDFLYFQAGPGELDDFALAARLSYFLWKSLPDDRLFLLANEGTLRNPDVLRNEVDRMLDDEKSQRFIVDFLGQWLELNEIDATRPDEKLYVEYDDVLRQAMLEETRRFFNELIWNDLGVRNLIDSDFTFLNR
ncbi:MAG: sulfatase-like hydrolase/transferase, partial [Verrucomicrobiota bacterium]